MAQDATAPIDPDDVIKQSFTTVRRGADPLEVQRYLLELANQLRTGRERERDLAAKLADAERRATPIDQLDASRLTALLGEETARVLDAARGAAAEIRAKAEENVARLLREARDEAQRMRDDAETVLLTRTEEAEAEVARIRSAAEGVREQAQKEADELRQSATLLREQAERDAAALQEEADAAARALRDQAEADAAAIRDRAEEEAAERIEAGRQEGREMVGEAQRVRQRMLDDLARRRKLLRQQIEQLQAGRDRLLAAYEVVRETLDVATEELHVALPEAKLAAEAAALKAAEDDAGASDEVTPAEPEATTPGVDADGESEPVTDVDADESAAPEVVADADVDTETETEAGSEDEPTDAADVPDEGDATAVDDPDEVEGDAAGPAPAVDADAGDTMEAADEDLADATRDTGTDAVVETDTAVEVDAEADEVEAEADEVEDEPDEVGPDEGERAEIATAEDEGAEPVDAATAAEPDADDEVLEADDEVLEEEAEDVRAPDPEEGRRSTAVKVVRPESADRTAAIFKRLRDEAPEDEVEERVAGAATMIDPTRTGPADDEVDLPDLDEVHPLQGARDVAVAQLSRSLIRRIKRDLSDEQNELLDSIRRQKGTPRADVVLPSATAHAERYRTAVLPLLADAADAGSELVADRPEPAEPTDVTGLATDLADGMVSPLRDRLERSFADSDGDRDELAERVRACYREWKAQRVDGPATRAVRAAANAGLVDRLGPDELVQWVVDDDGVPSPDCEDNGLAEPQPAGEPFPTGHRVPPLHDACRCIVVPVDAG